jgi:hypothetical protein
MPTLAGPLIVSAAVRPSTSLISSPEECSPLLFQCSVSQNDSNVRIKGPREDDSGKKHGAKNLVTLSFLRNRYNRRQTIVLFASDSLTQETGSTDGVDKFHTFGTQDLYVSLLTAQPPMQPQKETMMMRLPRLMRRMLANR